MDGKFGGWKGAERRRESGDMQRLWGLVLFSGIVVVSDIGCVGDTSHGNYFWVVRRARIAGWRVVWVGDGGVEVEGRLVEILS